MKLLFDLIPFILFFAALKIAGQDPEAAAALFTQLSGMVVTAELAPVLFATVAVIFGTIGQVAWVWFKHGKVDKMLWFSLAIVIIFGGLTIALQDKTFITWKPTVLYWGIAVSMGVALLIFKKNAMQAALGEQLKLPDNVWSNVNLSWLGFFVFMGALNLYVANHYSVDTWASFKLFGATGLLFAFVIIQGLFLAKHMEDK